MLGTLYHIVIEDAKHHSYLWAAGIYVFDTWLNHQWPKCRNRFMRGSPLNHARTNPYCGQMAGIWQTWTFLTVLSPLSPWKLHKTGHYIVYNFNFYHSACNSSPESNAFMDCFCSYTMVVTQIFRPRFSFSCRPCLTEWSKLFTGTLSY